MNGPTNELAGHGLEKGLVYASAPPIDERRGRKRLVNIGYMPGSLSPTERTCFASGRLDDALSFLQSQPLPLKRRRCYQHVDKDPDPSQAARLSFN